MEAFFAPYFSTALPLADIIIRLLAAAALGALVGFEREWRERPAGLRTHMLVSLASATFAIVALELILLDPFGGEDEVHADPLRLIEAITGGVAFLAAGFIVLFRGEVHGVTTGAGMWMASAVGLACGLGFLLLAFLGCLLSVIILTAIWHVELHLDMKEEPGGSEGESTNKLGS